LKTLSPSFPAAVIGLLKLSRPEDFSGLLAKMEGGTDAQRKCAKSVAQSAFISNKCLFCGEKESIHYKPPKSEMKDTKERGVLGSKDGFDSSNLRKELSLFIKSGPEPLASGVAKLLLTYLSSETNHD